MSSNVQQPKNEKGHICICTFGMGKSGKTTFLNVVKENQFDPDYNETLQQNTFTFERHIEGIPEALEINYIDVKGANLVNTKATVGHYAASGLLHIFFCPSNSATDFRFVKGYCEYPDYGTIVDDSYMIVYIVTKIDLKDGSVNLEECKSVAAKHNGLYYEVDMHDTDKVNEVFDDILKKFTEKQGWYADKKGKKDSKKDTKKDSKKESKKEGKEGKEEKKKGGCALL